MLLLTAKYDMHLPRDARELHLALEREGEIESEHIQLDSKTHQSIISSMRAVGEGGGGRMLFRIMLWILFGELRHERVGVLV